MWTAVFCCPDLAGFSKRARKTNSGLAGNRLHPLFDLLK
ncbi:MAG: hypothetical protein ACI90G_002256, partial [Urechidicola sp.]